MVSEAGSASAGRKGWPPQRRSTGSAGAFTTTTSQASTALRSLAPAFNWIATAVLPCLVVVDQLVPLELEGSVAILFWLRRVLRTESGRPGGGPATFCGTQNPSAHVAQCFLGGGSEQSEEDDDG